ncbi:hypothetical protein NESM_000248400 [Novymonas esmeraldas]|uniref:Translin-associated factor X-interacting protein 1 N-terminal domain-containing protein n=1 Tax=Novymonas esmeraldas TaxID=1808958 RepID=A0AAW0F844_9TRYP
MLDSSGQPRAVVHNERAPRKDGGAALQARRQPYGRGTPALDRGSYQLAPLDRALAATVAAADVPTPAPTASLPLVLSSALPTRHRVLSNVSTGGPVQMWPAAVSSRQRRRQAALESKAPLALQLEAFIRREHQQYLREHPMCARADCLHIFREVFNTFVNHFSEYKGILSVIRDEYDAALSEMAEKVKQMQVEYLESQSDRELHALELMQLKESMNATISNQKAQLSATQELVHAMRDQLTAAEHANSLLTLEMEQKRKTHMEAQQQVKLLSHAMIEESARTAAARETTHRMEKESQLQEARIKVLKENVAELEGFLRQQTYAQMEGHPAPNTSEVPPFALSASSSSPTAWQRRDGSDAAAGSFSKHIVSQLLARIDALEMRLAMAGTGTVAAPPAGPPSRPASRSAAVEGAASSAAAAPAAVVVVRPLADAALPVMREWLQREGVGEAEVEATDIIVPPGRAAAEAMGFLAVTAPVKHRHLSLAVAVRLIESMWVARTLTPDTPSRLPAFFLEWLRLQSGDATEAKALGVNILDTCLHNIHHPDCRALLAVIKGFLPEELVHLCRRRLDHLRRSTATSAATLHDKMAFDAFFAEVRAVCPEKSLANMLHLRFVLFRCRTDAGEVDLSRVLSNDAYFVMLFKQQWVQEVEAFTLRAVEGIRDEGDAKRGLVSLAKAARVLQGLDPVLGEKEVFKYISLACQRPLIDVASAAATMTTPLEAMLTRFRTSVLLYRRSPEDVVLNE